MTAQASKRNHSWPSHSGFCQDEVIFLDPLENWLIMTMFDIYLPTTQHSL